MRLLTLARETGINYGRLRREVAYDRFLARLQIAAPGEWLLKGGVALDLRFARGEARRTKDVDLETRLPATLQEATLLLNKATGTTLDDFFVFSLTSVPTGTIIDGVPAYRYGIAAHLDGRMYEGFTCDVGAADENIGEPELVKGRDLLEFAGITSAEVLAVPLNRHMADKLHAYVRLHNGIVSSRAKDLVDLALVTSYRPVASAGDLRAAIERVFTLHGVAVPDVFPPPPKNWAQSYPIAAEGIAVPGDTLEAHALVAALLNPVLSNRVEANRKWNPQSQRWEAES
jgi:Nucleotidyl transferase AbiEii toxin, Type IV TA system